MNILGEEGIEIKGIGIGERSIRSEAPYRLLQDKEPPSGTV